MFHPQYIYITAFPEDPIRQLIALRLHHLNNNNAQLNKEFMAIETELRDH